MTLVDTSVWVEHFKRTGGNSKLIQLLDEDLVLMHDFILGELFLGGAGKSSAWSYLVTLPRLPVSANEDALQIAARLLQARVGLVGVHLVASALIAGADILTLDSNLARAFRKLAGEINHAE